MGRRLALLIASNRYDDAGLRQLTAPPRDTESLAEVLADAEIAGFEVTTLINEPHHRVGAAIGEFYRTCRIDDLTLLYFSGHGLKDENGRLYLAMSNTQRDSLLFTSLPAEQIDQAMDGSAGRRQVLILDCCYSGAFPSGLRAKGDTEVHALERFRGRGRTVLTASDSTQYSFEGNKVKGKAVQSVFTKHLVEGLRDGSADLDGDGEITLDELYNFTYDRVVAETPHQRPKRQTDIEGKLVIARNVNWAPPVPVAAAVATAVSPSVLEIPAGPARWRWTTGILAGLAALLMITGALQAALTVNLFDGGPWRTVPYYVFGLIVVAAAAAVLAVRGSPGIAVGASFASIWGLLFFGSEVIHRRSASEGYLLELLGQVVLAVAGCFALLALHRRVVVRWRSLRDPLVWLVLLAAAAGSLALFSQQRAVVSEQRIFEHDKVLDSLALAFCVLLVLAFSVPIVTLFLLPDRVAGFVLIGWSAGGLGLSATTAVWQNEVEHGPSAGIVFGCSLILLAIAAVLRLRRSPMPLGEPRRWLVAVVAAASVLIPAAAAGTVVAGSRPYGPRIAIGGFAGDLAVGPVGEWVFVNRGLTGGLAVISTRDNKQEGGITAVPCKGAWISVGGQGGPVAVSPDGRKVYIASPDCVAAFEAWAPEQKGSVIPVTFANDLAFAQKADELYVATSAGVSIVSTTTKKLLGATLSIPGAYRLLPSADGRRMYVLGSPNLVWIIDTRTRKTIGTPAAHGTQHIALALGKADDKLYLANFSSDSLSVVDVKTMRAAGPAIDVGGVPFDLVSSPDGTRIYASVGSGDIAVIDVESDKVIDRLECWDGAMGLAISADGRRLYASSYGGIVSVVDTFH
jgi:DNA-binding beta-propeller fold protein YncE